MKLIILSLILLTNQLAIAGDIIKFEGYEEVKNSKAKYHYSGTYFSKVGGDFEYDFTKCHNHELEYMKSNSQGYKVLKSLGRSDQTIISKGVKDCLFVNNWKQYINEDGELQELMFSNLWFKTKKSMTVEEIEKSILDLTERKEWYKKYAPDLIK